MEKSLQVFCCYARRDKALLDELKTHLSTLQRQNIINVWHDGDISAGARWDQEIKKYLKNAKIILLLISPDFINSDYCYSIEMQHALSRHKRGEAKVISVIIRPTAVWKTVSSGDIRLGDLQALPTDAKPITSWTNHDEAWKDVAEGIGRVANELLEESPINRPNGDPPPFLPDLEIEGAGPISPRSDKDEAYLDSKLWQRRKLLKSFLIAAEILVALATGGSSEYTQSKAQTFSSSSLSSPTPTASPVSSPSLSVPSSSPSAPGSILYQVNWLDVNGWSFGAGWQISGGMLVCDTPAESSIAPVYPGSSSIGTVAVAPYPSAQTTEADYAVEAQIKLVDTNVKAYPDDKWFFELFVRATPGSYGYEAGRYDSRAYIDASSVSQSGTEKILPLDIGSSHTYRIEAKGSTISFLKDSHEICVWADEKKTYLTAGQAGLMAVGCKIQVSSFKVIAL